MKKYVIAVGSAKISKQVQEALFRAGFKWKYGEKHASYLSSPLIVLSCNNDRMLAHGDDVGWHSDAIRNKGYILISSQEVIADPFSLDGAVKPAKEMTVSQISNELGYDVKIVK